MNIFRVWCVALQLLLEVFTSFPYPPTSMAAKKKKKKATKKKATKKKRK